jgi:hypothetical protein
LQLCWLTDSLSPSAPGTHRHRRFGLCFLQLNRRCRKNPFLKCMLYCVCVCVCVCVIVMTKRLKYQRV